MIAVGSLIGGEITRKSIFGGILGVDFGRERRLAVTYDIFSPKNTFDAGICFEGRCINVIGDTRKDSRLVTVSADC